MSTVPQPYLTPAQYLDQERRAPFKSEYYQGETFAMAGVSRWHNAIVANLIRFAANRLDGRPCQVCPSDMRVKTPGAKLYTYPDVTIVCGEPRFEDGLSDTLVNPLVIIEVLSDSTREYDEGFKAEMYKLIPSLRELILVRQDRAEIRQVIWLDSSNWRDERWTGIDQSLTLTSLEISLGFAEIYRNVLPAPAPNSGGELVEQIG